MSDYFTTQLRKQDGTYSEKTFAKAWHAVGACLHSWQTRTREDGTPISFFQYDEAMMREDFAEMNVKLDVTYSAKVKGDWTHKKAFFCTYDDAKAGLAKLKDKAYFIEVHLFQRTEEQEGWRRDVVMGESHQFTSLD